MTTFVRVRSLNFLRQTNHAILLVKACTQPPPSTVPPAFAVPPAMLRAAAP